MLLVLIWGKYASLRDQSDISMTIDQKDLIPSTEKTMFNHSIQNENISKKKKDEKNIGE